MSARMAGQTPQVGRRADRGVALILVLLSMLVLSVLAATIVFTARSETFASYNYKLDTQADYLAKAGIQFAISWLRSNRYKAVPETSAGTFYKVTSSGPPFNLYTANTSPIQCVTASGCATPNSGVQLMSIPGTGSSNYPNITNGAGFAVATAFANDLGGATITVSPAIGGTPAITGQIFINAVLRNYQTVNSGYMPNVTRVPMETWYITSRAVLNGMPATAEETAVIQPIYSPYFGNAIYGYCQVGLNGSTGVCTDAYNSAVGTYGSAPHGPCDVTSPNVIDAGAGVGANGGVTLAGNPVVSGNVTIGSNPSGGCTASGGTCPCTGAPAAGTGTILGQIVNGPSVPPPALPPIGSGQPGVVLTTAPTENSTITLPLTSTGTMPVTYVGGPPVAAGACPPYFFVPGAPPLPYDYWIGPPTKNFYDGNGNFIASGNAPPPHPAGYTGPPPLPYVPPPVATAGTTFPGSPGPPPVNAPQYTYPPVLAPPPTPASGPRYNQPCVALPAGTFCNGTEANPYLISTISTTSATITLVGGPDIFDPVYYSIDTIALTGTSGQINACGYVVLNVASNMTIKGNGTQNTALANNPPEAMQIYYTGTNGVYLGGNGNISAVVVAPYASVDLKGGGASGYMLGAIQALNVTMSGNYPLHYDIQLDNAGGALGKVITISYNRKKM